MAVQKENKQTDKISKPIVVINWYGQVWRGVKDMLQNALCDTYIISRRELPDTYTWDNLPVKAEEIDYIINTHKNYELEDSLREVPSEFKGKTLFLQNWFNIQDIVTKLAVKDSLLGALNMSIKYTDRTKENVSIKINKPSSIYGIGSQEIVNLLNTNFINSFKSVQSQEYFFQLVVKATMNSIVNTLSVIYNLPASEALNEYGFYKLVDLTKEIISVVRNLYPEQFSSIYSQSFFMQSLGLIINAATAFKDDYPSTHQDYYEQKWEKEFVLKEGKIESEIDSLLGFVQQKALLENKQTPLVDELIHSLHNLKLTNKSLPVKYAKDLSLTEFLQE